MLVLLLCFLNSKPLNSSQRARNVEVREGVILVPRPFWRQLDQRTYSAVHQDTNLLTDIVPNDIFKIEDIINS
jgi:hypothetical protein